MVEYVIAVTQGVSIYTIILSWSCLYLWKTPLFHSTVGIMMKCSLFYFFSIVFTVLRRSQWKLVAVTECYVKLMAISVLELRKLELEPCFIQLLIINWYSSEVQLIENLNLSYYFLFFSLCPSYPCMTSKFAMYKVFSFES